MAKHIFGAEISHENAPLHIREKLGTDDASVKQYIQQLKKDLDEVCILSTSSRFVIYGVGQNITPLINFFFRDPILFHYVQFYKNTEAAVGHLFATASGLCSQVKGDRHILTQVKHAHQVGLNTGSIGLLLDSLLREAVEIGRKVRAQTGIDQHCVSLVDLGLDMLRRRLGELTEKKVLVIGTGKMARLVLDRLYADGCKHVTIVSHDAQRAGVLAARMHMQAGHIRNVAHYFMQADIIVGATDRPVSIFPTAAKPQHPSLQKRFVLDFGAPPNFDRAMAQYDSIEFFDRDNFYEQLPDAARCRNSVDEARKIVHAEAREFVSLFAQFYTTPILAPYWVRRLSTKDNNLKGFLSRITKPNARDAVRLRKLTYRFVHRLDDEQLRNLRLYTVTGDTQAPSPADVVRHVKNFENLRFYLSVN
ncbi:NAD(P)-binding domain-containing protein [Dawidia soli]|uniref:Glutamyl-tRNA reductase n=1 Tax=Dawidia soli TaxID=2782352 RepID=A0AAP2DD79_9BACT|nr:NAD(P)-binding domain-containing protein [Dawidia soli]MBT1689529.1 NAD(P)-binding domain-containing protein [Dawidia soli]